MPASSRANGQHRGISKRAITDRRSRKLDGVRLEVPASHGNKYGYPIGGIVVETSRDRCLVRLDITCEERWHPSALVRRWIQPDVERLSDDLAGLAA